MALNGNGVVDAIEQTAEIIGRENSVTREDYASSGGGVLRFIMPVYGGFGNNAPYKVLPEQLPQHNRYTFFSSKDSILLATPRYEAMWADAVAIAVTKAASWAWEIDSNVPLRRKRAQQVLLNSTAGPFTGWIHFMSAHLRSYIGTGKAIVEIERETSAYSSSIRALHHLNPLRCQLTDDPETPVLYYDRLGKVHELKYWQCMVFGDMVDPTLGEMDLVQGAAERAYRPITLLSAIEQYLYEKVTGKRALAMHFVQGLTETTIKNAITSADAARSGNGGMIYMGASVIPLAVPGDTPIQLVTIPLAELPDGFDPQLLRDDAYIKYANAIGLDVNDVDPRLAARQQFGSGAQSIILNEKSKGRGLSAWRQNWTHNTNWWVLDTATTFAFSEDTADDDLKQAQLAQTRVDTNSKRIADGIITADQARNLEVDAGDLPREFLVDDTTGGGTLSDTEKPTENAEGNEQEMPAAAPPTQPQQAQQAQQNGRVQPGPQQTVKHLAGQHDQSAHAHGGADSFSGTAYHGSGRPIQQLEARSFGNTTDAGKFGTAIYLSPQPHIARSYAIMSGGASPTVHSVRVNLKNPLRIKGDDVRAEVGKVARRLGVTSAPEWDGFKQTSFEFAHQFSRAAVSRGHDGVLYFKNGRLSEIAAFDASSTSIESTETIKERDFSAVAAYLIEQEEEAARELAEDDFIGEAKKAVETAVMQLEAA